MITIVCWKWEGSSQYRSKFTSEHVRILAAMIRRNTTLDHRIVCVTDDVRSVWGIPNVRPVQIWDEPDIQLPESVPNCYRRLKLFDKHLPLNVFGDRMISIDLDCVIVGNIDHILSEQADFCGWSMGAMPFNGSLWSLRVRSRPHVWEYFRGESSRQLAASFGYIGSDQAWMSYALSHKEKRFTPQEHGVYSWKRHIKGKRLPDNARIVFFHGYPDPWEVDVETTPNSSFIREHYRE